MSKTIRIACLGDIMPSGILHYEIGNPFISESLLASLNSSDIRVATLETAVGDIPSFDIEKMKRGKDVIYSPNVDLYRLNELAINVVSLANNHAWDLGWEGLQNTMRQLDKRGIKYCGAGENIQEASKPAIIETKGKRIAFIAYSDYKPGTCGYIPVASKNTPGINAMIEDNIKSDLESLKGKFDYLFVMMHWGKEYYYYPTPEVNRLAHKMIDWGADGIIGSHSHQIQPTISYKGKPIIFNLGNFFFPDRFINAPRSTYYPDTKPDLSKIPSTLGYPIVSEPTFKIWKPVARRGQIVSLVLEDNDIKTERIFSKLDNYSHLDIDRSSTPALFKFSHLLVKLPLYNGLFFCMRGSRFIRKKLRGDL